MTLLFIAFIAGILTALAPCILPLLPVIVGSSLTGPGGRGGKWKALIITTSLGLSVIAFTFLLKVSTLFITFPQGFWPIVSGSIILIFGLVTLFPSLWEHLPYMSKLSADSNALLGKGYQKKSFWGDVMIGASLGPVFSTCSPTYFIVLATVLPVAPVKGILYLIAYVVGLCLSLLLIAYVGQKIISAIGAAANPRGWFKRALGVLFIVVGIAVLTGYDKVVETGITNAGFFDVTKVEQSLLASQQHGGSTPDLSATPDAQATSSSATGRKYLSPAQKALMYPQAPELVQLDGYINTNGLPVTLAQYRGKKVVLLDIWTYSCINCQRTLPYVTSWYKKYEDAGLVVIGIHTPEFSFEKVQSNVEDAVKRFGITYPVVLDNEYQTWNALGNRFWPRKYLVDVDGYIVYDHAGEGNYDGAERAIQKALQELHDRLHMEKMVDTTVTTPVGATSVDVRQVGSPETYFGAARNEYLANGIRGVAGMQTLTLPQEVALNGLYLGGTWNFSPEYSAGTTGGDVVFRYRAKNVYFVVSSQAGAHVTLTIDGKPPGEIAGSDISGVGAGTIHDERLYTLIGDTTYAEHILRIHIDSGDLKAFTFTFG